MRIAILNNKQAIRNQLAKIILNSEGHELAWRTDSGKQAKYLCTRDLPDLLIMDPLIRDIGGVEVIRHIMAATPCPILIVTASLEERSEIVFDALGAGAIDAVNTPLVNSLNYHQAEQHLLRKIAVIEVLTKEPIASQDANKVSLDPALQRPEQNIVAIGCSSGGPDALARLLANLPGDFCSPIVIIQHVDAEFAPGMAQWLNLKSTVPVELAVSGTMPTPGKVLLSATDRHLSMTPDGLLKYQTEPSESPYKPSVDVFFNSLARYWKHSVTAILLSGMGNDGAHGMLELRYRGAYTIAQNKATSTVYGMPKAAVELGAAIEVLSIQRIAEVLAAHDSVARNSVCA